LGRFVSRDPIGFHGGHHLYRYASNRPLWAADPFGLEPKPCGEEDCKKCGIEKTGGFGRKPPWAKANDKRGKIWEGLTQPIPPGILRKYRKGCKPDITCCTDTEGGCNACANAKHFGHLDRGTTKIFICAQNTRKEIQGHGDCDNLYEILAHELIHLLDQCTGFGQDPNLSKCDACICDEFRAVVGSGQCEPGAVYYQIQGFASKDQCINRTVHDACTTACRDTWARLTDAQEIQYVADKKSACVFHNF